MKKIAAVFKVQVITLMAMLPLSVFATDINLADLPLALRTQAAMPNLMFLFDDSGSMGVKWQGDDVYYAPGYDSDFEYRCSSGTELVPVAGQTLDVYVPLTYSPAAVLNSASSTYTFNNITAGGQPYFSYSGNYYGWGGDTVLPTLATKANGATVSRVCFNPAAKYKTRLRANKNNMVSTSALITPVTWYTTSSLTVPWTYSYNDSGCDTAYGSGTWTFSCSSPASGTGVAPSTTSTTQTCQCKKSTGTIKTLSAKRLYNHSITGGTAYLSPHTTTDTTSADYSPVMEFTGNYLNWYFSATPATWSANAFLPGYPTYNSTTPWAQTTSPATDNPAGVPWTQQPATSFAYQDITVSKTQEGSPYDIFTTMAGQKPNVHFRQERIVVAADVGRLLVRKLSNLNLSIGSYHTNYAGTKSTGQDGYLMHGLASTELVEDDLSTSDDDAHVAAVKAATTANKTTLINQVSKLVAGGGTPTSQSMVRMASYFFQGWLTKTFDYFNGSATAVPRTIKTNPSYTIQQVLTKPLVEASGAKPPVPAYPSQTAPILTQGAWCQKSAMAVLTDGEPSGDTAYAGTGPLGTYDTVGTLNENLASYGTDYKGIMRVPGALYDHDWIPGIRGTQNIESFFIAFGDLSTVTKPIFRDAGMAGGGGTDNSFIATDGGAVVDAFKQIIQSVTSASLSITSIAVSSVAELKTENYAFQATYNSEYFASALNALNVNSEGLFVQPDGTGASRESAGIKPEWEASEVMSSMYILTDNSIGSPAVNVGAYYRANGVKDRRVYTWDGAEGLRFGSSTMTRPSSTSASFTEFNALPANIRNDISVRAGTNSQERYDMMMFLLGDITNELGHPLADAAHPLKDLTKYTEKYRRRAAYNDRDLDGKIDAVPEGGILGDVVHSSPVYLQEPLSERDDINYGTSTKLYSDYKSSQQSRKPMVYVGGNDGFLHGFTVEGGTKDSYNYPKGAELFAYMPGMVASSAAGMGLHNLVEPAYDHKFTVDLTPTLGDVFIDLSEAGVPVPDWRTVLVGGMSKGAKGYYAIDVTCPFPDVGNTCSDESFDQDDVMWEFDSTDDPDMGYSFSEPIITKINYNSGLGVNDPNYDKGQAVGSVYPRWAVIAGNGYNSANGRAVLFILFLDGGLDGTWTEGVDYLKIYVSDASTDSITSKNGLSSPTAMDINLDGMVDRIYVGDIKGHMWTIDVAAAGTKTKYNAGTLIAPAGTVDATKWVANLLFTTGVDAANPQPITTAPMVSRDTKTVRKLPKSPPDLMVVFGTGRYLAESDIADKSLQTVYAVHDRGVFNLTRYDTVTLGSETYQALEPRIFKEITLGSNLNRYVEGKELVPVQYGWYADLGSDLDGNNTISGSTELLGERLTFRSIIAGDLFIFNTIIPIVGSCAGATQGWTMVLDWTTGSAYREETYDADNNGLIDSMDQGYIGDFNDAAGSAIGRAGDNIFYSEGDNAISAALNFGSLQLSERVGWEEKMPFGIKGQ